MSKDEMIVLARDIAQKHNLPPDVVMGLIEKESSWCAWAIRFEPRFEQIYIERLSLASMTEKTARSISWGPMQVMGQVARERGFTGEFLSELCDPPTGIEFGCRHLAGKLSTHLGDMMAALLSYNGGADHDYGRVVLQNANFYRNSQLA
jgi:soluble lytic murein transglycosylase-like protein